MNLTDGISWIFFEQAIYDIAGIIFEATTLAAEIHLCLPNV